MAKKKKAEQEDNESLVSEAINNIRRDRSQAQLLLTKLLESMIKNENSHRDVGFVASKYLEVLQRSNEQLVKIVQMTQKSQGLEENLSEEEKEGLFDEILDNKDLEEDDD